MASSFVPTPTMSQSEKRPATKGTMIFSYTCVGLTSTTLFCVLFFYFYRYFRSRAPVTAASAGNNPEEHHVGADITKLSEFAYTQSSRRHGGGDGAQCSVCIGTVQAGEMVRRLPLCKHLYHVECIDMWLVSHATCPLCRSDVEPPVDGQAASTEQPQALPV
ncbi:RING-H2 finger protein ATL39-like [Phragmites australis]|uniref:RING-H2 finger protein ATL39-like n=1 Tax=Phragmites australis TaxID=29695 RepID=UPI002D78A324|nr:RING-H2 finger protein ATL39-like [Phragmites australis]